MRIRKGPAKALPTRIEWGEDSFLSIPREVTLTDIASEIIARAKSAIDDGTDRFETAAPDEETRWFIGHHSILRRYVMELAGGAGLTASDAGEWRFAFVKP